jgi:hypothetical protein
MSLTWLFLGAIIGVNGGQGKGGGIQIACMMIGGMMVLSIAGVLLGLVGGDAKGSVAGAAGGLLGSWIAGCFGAVPIQPQALNVIVIFGALVGATGFLFVRFLVWKYGLMFRTIRWVIGVTPSSGKARALAGLALMPNRPTRYSVDPASVRSRLHSRPLGSRSQAV